MSTFTATTPTVSPSRRKGPAKYHPRCIDVAPSAKYAPSPPSIARWKYGRNAKLRPMKVCSDAQFDAAMVVPSRFIT